MPRVIALLQHTGLKKRFGCERKSSQSKMSKTHPPELKKYMDKRLSLKLNGGRHVTGVLRGFDPFMNLVLDEAIEEASAQQKNNIGMVVIRGNSIVTMEALDRVL
ncbi:small nuclear ribonucleoprotein G-like [Acropora palmata]|uniref:small nuclear ribonucleoprotein G-like n=2 Tax=Acropora TaxID=6127 RepID=UPI003DA19E73